METSRLPGTSLPAAEIPCFGLGTTRVGGRWSRDDPYFARRCEPRPLQDAIIHQADSLEQRGPARAILCQFVWRGEPRRVMDRWGDDPEWDERAYIVDRAQLLNQV